MRTNHGNKMSKSELKKEKRGQMTLLIITVSLILFGSGVTLGSYIG